MSLHSCGFDNANAQFDMSSFNTEEMNLETLSIADQAIDYLKGKALFETLSLVDYSKVFDISKRLRDNIYLVESMLKDVTTTKTETLTLTETLTKLTTLVAFAETLTILDGGLTPARAKTLTEAFTGFADTIGPFTTTKVFQEDMFLTDTTPRDFHKRITVGLTLVASISNRTLIKPAFIESLSLTHQAVIKSVDIKLPIETMTFDDFSALLMNISKQIQEILDLDDSIKKDLTYHLSDTVNLSDSKNISVAHTIVNNLNLQDNLYTLLNKIITEILTIIDSGIKKDIHAKKQENLTLNDFAVKKTLNKIVMDTLNLVHRLTMSLSKNLLDVFELSDIQSGLEEVRWLYSALIDEGKPYTQY